MEFRHVAENLSQEVIDRLSLAIEIGRWENGEKLTPEQLESAMQAVMLWQAKNIDNSATEPFIVGPKGELYTGKGEMHKLPQAEKYDASTRIAIKKV